MADEIDMAAWFPGVGDQDKFWAIRGHAIQAYAGLEQSLCQVLAALAEIPGEVAGIIFFKVTSSAARDSILSKLIKRKHGLR